MSPSHDPLVSVVVVIVSDTTERHVDLSHLVGCLDALTKQRNAPTMEIIVPHHDDVGGIERLRTQFPEVTFLRVRDVEPSSRRGASREHHDVLRARGLAAARGELVALLEDHVRPDESWCASIVAAHAGEHAAIGGAIENAIDRPLNWAVYFCDFGRYQNPLPRGESYFASDANVAYKRAALERIRPAWEHSFREVVVHAALRSNGEKVALTPDVVIYQHRHRLGLASALRERFVWGRSYAATRSAALPRSRRLAYGVLCPVLPMVLLSRMAGTAWERRTHVGKFVRAVPLIAILTIVWSIGEGVGYLTGQPRDPGALGA